MLTCYAGGWGMHAGRVRKFRLMMRGNGSSSIQTADRSLTFSHSFYMFYLHLLFCSAFDRSSCACEWWTSWCQHVQHDTNGITVDTSVFLDIVLPFPFLENLVFWVQISNLSLILHNNEEYQNECNHLISLLAKVNDKVVSYLMPASSV